MARKSTKRDPKFRPGSRRFKDDSPIRDELLINEPTERPFVEVEGMADEEFEAELRDIYGDDSPTKLQPNRSPNADPPNPPCYVVIGVKRVCVEDVPVTDELSIMVFGFETGRLMHDHKPKF